MAFLLFDRERRAWRRQVIEDLDWYKYHYLYTNQYFIEREVELSSMSQVNCLNPDAVIIIPGQARPGVNCYCQSEPQHIVIPRGKNIGLTLLPFQELPHDPGCTCKLELQFIATTGKTFIIDPQFPRNQKITIPWAPTDWSELEVGTEQQLKKVLWNLEQINKEFLRGLKRHGWSDSLRFSIKRILQRAGMQCSEGLFSDNYLPCEARADLLTKLFQDYLDRNRIYFCTAQHASLLSQRHARVHVFANYVKKRDGEIRRYRKVYDPWNDTQVWEDSLGFSLDEPIELF